MINCKTKNGEEYACSNFGFIDVSLHLKNISENSQAAVTVSSTQVKREREVCNVLVNKTDLKFKR